MNYFQFHIGDYASHTRNLSLMEDLAYRRLLDEYYLHEKPLLCGVQAVARQIGMRDHAAEVQFVLEAFFQLTDDGWTNPRADAEIAKYREYAAAGKRGAEKRWGKGSNSPPNAGSMLTINHKPITNKKNIYATPDGVSESVWQDFVILRKSKRAAITNTAIKGIVREAAKAGISLEAAIRMCCERGWVGFKADWIATKQNTKVDKQLAAARTIFGDERRLSNDGLILDQ
jgi:uncharacterized protein YdaU (DUF1376 family)